MLAPKLRLARGVSDDKRPWTTERVYVVLSPMDRRLGWKGAVLELLATGIVSVPRGNEFLSGLLSTVRLDTLKIAGRPPIYGSTGPLRNCNWRGG